MWELDSAAADVPAALHALCAEVGGEGITPGANCGGMFAGPRRPALPSGAQAGWGARLLLGEGGSGSAACGHGRISNVFMLKACMPSA